MKRKGLLVLLVAVFVSLAFAAPSLAQTIKLTFADQNAEVGWGPVHATAAVGEEDRGGH